MVTPSPDDHPDQHGRRGGGARQLRARALQLFACAWSGLAAWCLCACAHVPSSCSGPRWLELNQLALEPGSHWNGDESILRVGPSAAAEPPSFDDPRSVLAFILASAPEPAVVYPTERYNYYKFPLGPRLISGNIRFADVEDGRFSVGYFDAYNQRDTRVGDFSDGQDGVWVRYDPASATVTLALDGLSHRFVLDRRALGPTGRPLLPGERFVSGVRDESGYFFELLYYEPGRSFYYVLDNDMPRPEPWVRGESDSIEAWFGERSRFCFVRHPQSGRFILVGVNSREIAQNTWYDGPFDQVPPRLPLRPLLEQAYPYIIDAGGVDEHGNFLKMEGQRVAISPYRAYESGPELENELEQLILDVADPTAWTSATYEYKRDWRPPADASMSAHDAHLSVSWPANHWGGASRAWGASHSADVSRSWPPNHDVLSSSRPDAHTDR